MSAPAPEIRLDQDYEQAYQYALTLADSLRKRHYPDNTDWRPLHGDLVGLLTQIDNMVADLCDPTQDERVRALVMALHGEATHRLNGHPHRPDMTKVYAALRALEQGEG